MLRCRNRLGKRQRHRVPFIRGAKLANVAHVFFALKEQVAIGVVVLLIIILLIQYWIHYQFEVLKTNPFTGKMVTDPPVTIFRYV